MTAAWAAALLLIVLPATALAADPLDPAFGTAGVSVSRANGNGEIDAIARDSEGRLVAAGTTEAGFIVQRFLPDGSLDPSFSVTGTRFSGNYVRANAVAVLPDGKILVAGQTWTPNTVARYLVTRYLPDGGLDPAFGRRGRVIAGPKMYDGEALALAVQPDGRFLIAGWSADTRFGFCGIAMRFKPNGALDPSFSRNGYTRIGGGDGAFLRDIALAPDGKIVLAGEIFDRFMTLRLFPDGRLDTSFGKWGFAISNVAARRGERAYPTGLALLPGGRFLLSGNVEGKGRDYVALARYRPDGRPDRSFGEEGVVRTRSSRELTTEAMAVRRDGRITLAGYRAPRGARPQVAIQRYLPGGRPDPGFGDKGLFTRRLAYESVATSLLALPDGSTLVAGRSNPSAAAIQETAGEEFVASALEKAEFLLMRLRP